MIAKCQREFMSVLIMATVCLGGCRSIAVKTNIVPVEVNVVGINKSQFPYWQGMSMTAYWEPENQDRKQAKKDGFLHEMRFSQSGSRELILARNDSIWKKWKKKKTDYLFIMANLPPGTYKDQTGSADKRRLIIPYECWGRFQGQAEIIVDAGGISSASFKKCEFP